MAKIRPIDANIASKMIKQEWNNQAEQSPSGFKGLVPMAYADCFNMLSKIETLDVRKNIHAHWYEFNVDICGHPLHCSNCHWSDYHIPNNIVENFKICPECGAIMDEEPY